MKCLCTAVLFLAVLTSPAGLFADERILDYHSHIELHGDGQLTVSETIRVRAEGRNIRRGIFRDFPTRYRDRFGNHVNVAFHPVSVQRNGETEAWHTEKRSNGVRLYAGSADRMLPAGVHEYRLVFTTDRQLGFFDDHDELYFNAVGNGWAFPIDRAVAEVELPFSVAPEQLQTHVFTGPFGSRASNADIRPQGRGVRFESRTVLQPGEGMTVSVGWPKGLVAEPGARQKLAWFLADNGAAIALLAGLLLPLAWYLRFWDKLGRDPRKGVIIPRFEPPGGFSPAACRYLLAMGLHRDAFTAAIISLAVKGRVVIREDDEEYTLQRTTGPGNAPLSPGEQAVLAELLPVAGARLEMKNENHAEFQAARNALKSALKQEYLGQMFNRNGIYLLPAILMSAAAAIVAAFLDGGPALWITYVALTLLLHGLFAWLMRAPTVAGRQVMDEIEGFRMYLGTAERDRLEQMRSPALTPEVFEAFLPYAYALGVENGWCERFASEIPAEVRDNQGYNPSWYRGRMRGVNALHHLGDDFSSSFSSAISSASSPPGSSSGSGGSSGGGGGGGGGGGW